MDTIVHIEPGTPIHLFIPGPNASKAACTLDRIRDLATEACHYLRYTDDAAIDPLALELVEEALHKATRLMRHSLDAHNHQLAAELHAQQFAADTGTDTETPDNEPFQGAEP